MAEQRDGLAYIIAASTEASLLALNSQLSVVPMLTQFAIPVLVGNIVGGTALFALIAYAQVMKEI